MTVAWWRWRRGEGEETSGSKNETRLAAARPPGLKPGCLPWRRGLPGVASAAVQALTLIRAAGGVYDFRNFGEVYLCNGLRSELQILCIPRKTSREYVLLSTLERKTAFLAIYRTKRPQNRPFFRRFWLFRTAVKVFMTSMNSPPPPPGRALPPPIVGAPSSSGAACTVSSSF
jgi:hypothetical protein